MGRVLDFLRDPSGGEQMPDRAELLRLEIVGETHYQRELDMLAGPKTDDGVSVWLAPDLVPEPHNQYDPTAVPCRIDNVTVGYLPRTQCAAFHRMMAAAQMAGEPLTEIDAEIRGGWLRPDGDEGHYGVTLYVPEVVARQLQQ